MQESAGVHRGMEGEGSMLKTPVEPIHREQFAWGITAREALGKGERQAGALLLYFCFITLVINLVVMVLYHSEYLERRKPGGGQLQELPLFRGGHRAQAGVLDPQASQQELYLLN